MNLTRLSLFTRRQHNAAAHRWPLPSPFTNRLSLLLLLFGMLGLGSALPQPSAGLGGSLFYNSGQALADQGGDVALGDVDGDGDVDAFIARSGADGVWLNDGQGTFSDSGQSLRDQFSVAVRLGDLDGDGDMDGVVLEDTAAAIVVWLNQGGVQGGTPGVFAPGGAPFGPDLPGDLALGDLDGDTDLDIFLARTIGRPAQVWWNNGMGQFSDSGQVLTSSNSSGVNLGDVDGDGDLDALTADGTHLRLWLNQGGVQGGSEGVFADSGQTLPTNLSQDVALGDVDGDGDLDAASTQVNSGWQLWLNQGGGVFAAAGSPLGGNSNRHINLVDVDGDTDLDVFLARFGANTVWLNQGNGSFQDSGEQLGTLSSEGAALADLDGDSDADLVVANFSGDNEVWCNGPCGSPNLTWQLETVETFGNSGQGLDMVVDAEARPHLVVVQQAGDAMYHLVALTWDGVTWQSSRVTITTGALPEARIRIASDGSRHIFTNLQHFTSAAAGWSSENIPYPNGGSIVNTYPVVDGDRFHVFGRTSSNQLVHLLRQADGSWVTLNTNLFGGLSSNAAGTFAGTVDGQGRLHLIYLKGSTLRYAVQNGANWVETNLNAAAAAPFSLVVDSQNRPHLTYRQPGSTLPFYRTFDGATWHTETIQTEAVSSVALALDSSDTPQAAWWTTGAALTYGVRTGPNTWSATHVTSSPASPYLAFGLTPDDLPVLAYHDTRYGDVRLAWSGPAWEEQIIVAAGSQQTPSLALQGDIPGLTYNNTQVNYAPWNGNNWNATPLGAMSDASYTTPLLYDQAGQPHLAYYQAASRTFFYAHFDGTNWQSEPAYTLAANQVPGTMLFLNKAEYGSQVNLMGTVVQNGTLYLGVLQRDEQGSWLLSLWSPGVGNPANFPFAAATRGDGIVVFIYSFNNVLYRATFAQNQWLTAPILNNVQPSHLALAVETRRTYAGEGVPPTVADQETFALADTLSGELRYGANVNGVWQTWVAGTANNIQDLALVHRAAVWRNPTLAMIGADNAVVVASATQNLTTWTTETVAAATPNTRSHLSLAYAVRERLTWQESGPGGNEIHHAFRRAPVPLAGTGQSNGNVPLVGALYKGGCLCLFFGLNGCTDGWFARAPLASGGTYTPSGNLMVDLTALFQTTAEGNAFVQLYGMHDHELWRTMVADPGLLWDGYRTLNNLLPGLEALTTGAGAQVTISQGMMDDALDIWQRIAAAAAPPLANEINNRLAATNNLQDYVGMTFDEWAISLGVEPPGHAIYLPLVLSSP